MELQLLAIRLFKTVRTVNGSEGKHGERQTVSGADWSRITGDEKCGERENKANQYNIHK